MIHPSLLFFFLPFASFGQTPNTQHPTPNNVYIFEGSRYRLTLMGQISGQHGDHSPRKFSLRGKVCVLPLLIFFFFFFQFFRLTVCSPPPPPPPRSHFVSPRFKKIFPCSSKHSLHPKTITKTLLVCSFFSFHLFSFSPTQTIQYILIFFLFFFPPFKKKNNQTKIFF